MTFPTFRARLFRSYTYSIRWTLPPSPPIPLLRLLLLPYSMETQQLESTTPIVLVDTPPESPSTWDWTLSTLTIPRGWYQLRIYDPLQPLTFSTSKPFSVNGLCYGGVSLPTEMCPHHRFDLIQRLPYSLGHRHVFLCGFRRCDGGRSNLRSPLQVWGQRKRGTCATRGTLLWPHHKR